MSEPSIPFEDRRLFELLAELDRTHVLIMVGLEEFTGKVFARLVPFQQGEIDLSEVCNIVRRLCDTLDKPGSTGEALLN